MVNWSWLNDVVPPGTGWQQVTAQILFMKQSSGSSLASILHCIHGADWHWHGGRHWSSILEDGDRDPVVPHSEPKPFLGVIGTVGLINGIEVCLLIGFPAGMSWKVLSGLGKWVVAVFGRESDKKRAVTCVIVVRLGSN